MEGGNFWGKKKSVLSLKYEEKWEPTYNMLSQRKGPCARFSTKPLSLVKGGRVVVH